MPDDPQNPQADDEPQQPASAGIEPDQPRPTPSRRAEVHLYLNGHGLPVLKPWRLVQRTQNPFYLARVFEHPGVYWLIWGETLTRRAGFCVMVVRKRRILRLWKVRYASHVPGSTRSRFAQHSLRFQMEGYDIRPGALVEDTITRLVGPNLLGPPKATDRYPDSSPSGPEAGEPTQP